MKTIYKMNGTRQQAVVDALRKVGLPLVSLDEPLLENEVACLVDTLNSQDKQKVANGDAMFSLKNKAKFENKYGTVTSIDFDLVQVQKVRVDPVIIVDEIVPGPLNRLVRVILEDTVKADIIKAAIFSIDSDGFEVSVRDLARLTGEEPEKLYRKCVSTIVQSCIIGMQRLDVFSEETPKEQTCRNEEVYS